MGYPVTYSLSPLMHNRALEVLQLDYVYLAFPVPIDRFSEVMAGFFACESIVGFNLTIPHKEQILPYLKEISPLAQTVGAVNTVKRSGGGWVGTNTDVDGFCQPLVSFSLATALILGSGGAAKATIVGCQKLGIKTIHVAGRSPDKLARLADQFPVTIHPWERIDPLLPHLDLVVNCTPIGMADQPGSPLSPSLIQNLPHLHAPPHPPPPTGTGKGLNHDRWISHAPPPGRTSFRILAGSARPPQRHGSRFRNPA